MNKSKLGNVKLIVFDFDGVIANTKKFYLRLAIKHLKRAGVMEREIKERVFVNLGKRMHEVLMDSGLSIELARKVAREVNKEAVERSKKIRPCKCVKHIRKLKPKYKLVLLSNSVTPFLKKLLKKFKLESCFYRVTGGDKFKSKEEIIRKLKKQYKLKQEQIAYVGDRAADVETAKKAGCISVIIASKCAWNSRANVLEAGPDFLFSNLCDFVNTMLHTLEKKQKIGCC